MYEECGGNLTRDSSFGLDPLVSIEHAYQSRNSLFRANQPTGQQLFSDLVHNRYDRVVRALEYFFELTLSLSEQLD